jgi:RNA polymerase sigma-70 factor, ECF subfamily
MSALPSRTADAARTAETTRVLYERYSRRIFAYCVSRLGSRDEAEDAMQTTFLNAFRSLQSGVVPQFELAWLFRIAENVCRDGHKSASRRRRIETTKDLQEVQDVLAAPQRSEGLVGISDALASIPERQRQAILLREWQGLSYGEIADKLELSGAAVETLIFRARRSLVRALEAPRRVASSFNLVSLLGIAKSVFKGSAAAKAAASAAAVGGVALVASVPLADQSRRAIAPHGPPPALSSAVERPAAQAPVSSAAARPVRPRARIPVRRAGPTGSPTPARPAVRTATVPAFTPGRGRPSSTLPAATEPPAASPRPDGAVTPPASRAQAPVASPPASLPSPRPEVPGLPDLPPVLPPTPPLEPPTLPPLPEAPVGLPLVPPLPPPPPLP